MADAVVSRLGQINQAGAVDALFMKVFAGEVLTAFEEANLTLDKHRVRTIKNGKSAQFPATGKIGARYHTPGTEITGQNVNHAERIISIDALLISDVFIADIDEAMNHYDVRSIYSTEMGRKLAKEMDINVFSEIIKAARANATVTDGFGGSQILDDKFKLAGTAPASTTLADQASALAAGLFTAAQKLDEKDIPEDNRFAIFRPAEYYALVQNKDVINRDWGGSGAYSEGKVFRIAGINILKSNHLPSTDTTATNTYHGVNATKTVAVVFTPEAVGTVKLMDLSMQSAYDIRRQGTLMVARYAVGHGILRPECAIELSLNTLTN